MLSYARSETRWPPGVVAIPSFEWMWTQSAAALLRLQAQLPRGSTIDFERGVSSPAGARNGLIERALAMKTAEWVLFLDADMTPPEDTVTRLLAHEKDVVAGLCCMRVPPYHSTVWWLKDDAGDVLAPSSPHGLHEVDFAGAACMLVRRRVLEAMGAPWFEHPMPGTAEDIVFCRKARALGFPVFADLDLRVGHMTTYPIYVRDTP